MRKILAAVIAVATSALAIAACSSSSSSSSSSSTGGSTSTSSSATAGSASQRRHRGGEGVPAPVPEHADLDRHQHAAQRPSPHPGSCSSAWTPASAAPKVLAQYWAQAAADIGWKYKDLISGSTPAAQQAAMNSAIQLNPAGILTSGIPNSTIQTQLALAAQKGIWVNSSADTQLAVRRHVRHLDREPRSARPVGQDGRRVRGHPVQRQGRHPGLPADRLPDPAGLRHRLRGRGQGSGARPARSPRTRSRRSAIGTTTPPAVVSAVTRNPSTNWLIFDLGDLEIGVDAALTAAGLHGLHIGGLTADTPNIAGAEDRDAGRLDRLLAADRRLPSGGLDGPQVRGHADPHRGPADAADDAAERQLPGGGLGRATTSAWPTTAISS